MKLEKNRPEKLTWMINLKFIVTTNGLADAHSEIISKTLPSIEELEVEAIQNLDFLEGSETNVAMGTIHSDLDC